MKDLFKTIGSGIIAICFFSCSEGELSFNSKFSSDELQLSQFNTVETKQLLPFAKALHSAMKESPALRKMIKNEALKRFNKEYELLYQFIKDEEVENELSVRELLLKYFNDTESLLAIETQHPTLTIHIPILPENSFSADIWNTIEQVPAVAIHSSEGLNPIIVSEKGQYVKNSDVFVIESGSVPGFPVLVLKDNPRVVVSNNASSRYPSLNNRNSDYVFDFIDDYFDGSIEEENEVSFNDDYFDGSIEKENKVSLRQYSFAQNIVDPKVINAYDIFGTSISYWQRNHIYYNLTTSTTTGTFSSNYSECIYAFSFSKNHSPEQVLNTFTLLPTGSWPWTAGQYNFRITAEIVSQTYPTSTTRLFAAYPEELFSVTWTKQGNTFYNTFEGFNAKVLNLPLFTWDLEYYSHGMKVSIWKVNLPGTVSLSNTLTTGYTTNVSYNISDMHLGDVVVSFGDPVITGSQYNAIKQQMFYNIKEYTTGICIVMLSPKKQY